MKDEHTNGKKMARNGRNTVIYKGTFVSNHSLVYDGRTWSQSLFCLFSVLLKLKKHEIPFFNCQLQHLLLLLLLFSHTIGRCCNNPMTIKASQKLTRHFQNTQSFFRT